jgi:hypothetical protein
MIKEVPDFKCVREQIKLALKKIKKVHNDTKVSYKAFM